LDKELKQIKLIKSTIDKCGDNKLNSSTSIYNFLT